MVDIEESKLDEWFQVTENLKNWESQINKLKEDLSEFSEDRLEFDFKFHRVEEEV